ncbi:MAG: HAD family phosphatase [Novosphingobium sp.]|nr:HAD family phosphatase [Novosphingobium sp.]
MSEAHKAPVRAVVFDVGRVLYEWDLRYLFAKLIDDEAELDWFLAHVVTPEWHFEHDAGRPLAEMVPERMAMFPDHADLIQAYAARFNETIPCPVAGSHDLVRALSARGLPLFAITNFGAEFWDQFRPTAPIFELFEDIVVSGVEKMAKPDPSIYELAASRFGHLPGEMLFIDDNLSNIEAAAALGWQVHHFTAAGRLGSDLRERNLIS